MLYTGKGDKGDTSFFGSDERDLKSSLQAESLGSLDEINSLIGLCRAKAKKDSKKRRLKPPKVVRPTPPWKRLKKKRLGKKGNGKSISKILERVQQDLFIIQAAVAGSQKNITKEKIIFIEGIINEIEKEMPPIKTFFLPGGTELSALLDYARTVARRTERVVVRYSRAHEVSPESLAYLNRLSSLLYALVRFVNFKAKVKEIPPTYE